MDGLIVTVLLLTGAVCTQHQAAATQRTGQLSAYRIASFQNPDSDPNAKLNHVIFHSPTGDIYVGAVDSIYRLNNSLVLESNASTALDCTDADEDCFNYNKVIFVEPRRNALITCGSENGGRCQQRDLDNLMVTSMSDVRVSPGRDKTTVSLLAPGPSSRDWLYVASTYTRVRDIKVAPVSRRDLDQRLPDTRLLFADDDSIISFSQQYFSQTFDINYVYGFASNGYTYFVTTQQPGISNRPTFVSKVIRVCHTSPNLDSYTEIILQCGEGSSLYNLAQAAYHGSAGPDFAGSLGVSPGVSMLFAVFAKNVGTSNTPSESSALCAFSIADIENAFVTAVQNCIQLGGDYSIGYLEGTTCPVLPSFEEFRELLCDTQNLYQHANNPTGVRATPLLQLEDSQLTSIITSIEINHTIAFIGTSQGSLLKVHIENGTSARHYETIKLGDSAVLTDISLDEQLQQIHVLTEQQLLRLRVENCNQYTSCETCIGESGGQDGDPYCGWCTIQNKCTTHSECPMAGVSSRWLPYNTVQCIGISVTNPGNLPITDPQQMITLTVEQLPDLKVGQTYYSCQFDDLAMSQGTTTGNTIECMTPERTDIPPIPQMEDHVTMQLSVFSSESNLNFISSNFSFYNCLRHASCTQCVKSDWDCDWCVYDNVCTHQSNNCTQGDYIVTGINNPDATSMQGSGFCPQLQPQTGDELVPVGVAREILVYASNLPNSTQLNKAYQCSLMVEETMQTSPATLLPNDILQCNSQMYKYAAIEPELEVKLTVSWNGDRTLDDEYEFTVTLYKCDVDRLDCSRCLSNETARPELECRWCGSQCAFKDDDVCSSSALDSNDPCPAPSLVGVDPKTGPMEGNTVIEITGTDIGRRFQDVRSVMVGQQSCDLTGLEDQYVTGMSVRCRTSPMSLGDAQLITISVAAIAPAGTGNLTSTGNVEFTYTNPMITSFSPSMGPADGGTMITIMGTDMNTGRDTQAMVATNIPCDIDRESIRNTAIVCRTGNSTEGNAGPVLVTFDGAVRSSTDVFTYKPNPNVTDINPRESIMSGGRSVNVIGKNFLQIQTPMMISTLEMNSISEEFVELCSTTNDTHLTCQTPSISLSSLSTMINTGNAPSVIIGFIMADVSGLLRWSKTQAPSEFQFRYVEDPTYDVFEEDGRILELVGTKLTIRGSELSTALTLDEVKVFIGEEDCIVEVFDSSILTCEAPAVQPEPLDYDGNQTSTSLPAVYVQHSGLYFFIGYVRYVTSIVIGIYIGIAAAVMLLPLLIVALLLWRKLRGSQKEIGEILIQMEEVEKGMAEDLRIAFAELQTNVTDLTHDLAGTGMPFVSHRQYAANMLFIGLDIQPETSDPHNPEENTERAMVQFNKLLVNKSFLLAFIQTIDDDKKMPVKEKATIASLLTVIMMLEDKLGYLTDIMITLMSSQVQEAVDNNRPKQLFRRTESIVEKLLSNWIALCLYDQLKDHTAFPLFLLYSGIKVQTEKGPVDAITRQAHFSLSEERLLKGNVEFNDMTLHVVVDSEDGEKKEVKVLDVDAIPQVKEKILDSMYRNKPYSDRQRAVNVNLGKSVVKDSMYRNKPYSDRQRAVNVNLEWRQGKTGRLALQDVALPQIANPDSKDRQKWQKLNTLTELGVPDNSLMALVPKQLSHTSINEATSGTASKDASLYQQEVDLEDGVTIWHLEKPQEEIEESEKQRKKRQREMAHRKGKKSQNITFPRLLTMKGIIQEYVDKMFHAILTVDGTPLAIKYLFDFFDSQASRHGIEDPDISHIWKSNTLPLRFWVSAITHPNYIFDIRPTPSVESSLGVVGQAFYDACNKSDHQLGWESSFNKLLYNREVNKYRGLVESFYEGIGDMKHTTTSDLEGELDKTCKNFTGLFSKLSTLLQLYEFTKGSKRSLMSAMEEDDVDNLAYELEQVEVIMGNNE